MVGGGRGCVEVGSVVGGGGRVVSRGLYGTVRDERKLVDYQSAKELVVSVLRPIGAVIVFRRVS